MTFAHHAPLARLLVLLICVPGCTLAINAPIEAPVSINQSIAISADNNPNSPDAPSSPAPSMMPSTPNPQSPSPALGSAPFDAPSPQKSEAASPGVTASPSPSQSASLEPEPTPSPMPSPVPSIWWGAAPPPEKLARHITLKPTTQMDGRISVLNRSNTPIPLRATLKRPCSDANTYFGFHIRNYNNEKPSQEMMYFKIGEMTLDITAKPTSIGLNAIEIIAGHKLDWFDLIELGDFSASPADGTTTGTAYLDW